MATRILVVNDTEEILEIFRDLLGEEGYEVITYSYAPHDLAEIERVNPDLVILDFVLGGGERQGWQLLQKLRLRRATAKIPVVVCTGAVQEVREMEGYLHAQGVSVVFKPFDIDQLLLTITSALATRGSAASLVDDAPASDAPASEDGPAGSGQRPDDVGR